MSTLRLPGLLTGIDTSTLIAQLMAVERRTLNVYEERQSLWEERQDALDTLESKLSNLRSTVRALSDADELRAFTTTSSDEDKLTAGASYNAFEGTHTVVINQLATAERWVHTAGKEYVEDYVGAGTFTYSYNFKETSVTTTATTTLEDLVGLINNDANNPGVTASLLYYNDAYHLVLNGDDAGSDYAVQINSGTTEVWKSDSAFTNGSDNATLNTKITELDQFTLNNGLQGDEQIEITGTDHFGNTVAQVDLSVTGNTKLSHLISEINDAFDGRAKAVLENGKIILTDSACDTSSLSITLTYDQGSGDTTLTGLGMSEETAGAPVATPLSGFEDSDFTKSQAAQDSQIRVDGFPASTAVSEVQTVSLSDSPNSGTYTLTYRGETTTDLNHNDDATTIKAALEALSTVNTDDITVSGPLDDGMTFTFADTLGNVDLIMIDDSLLMKGATPVTASIAETTPGQNGWNSRSSNTLDDVIYGVTLHLHDTTDANGEEITLTRDVELVKSKLSSMVDAYNFAINYIQEKTGYNDILKTGGVLMGDYVVSTIRNQLINPLISQTSGFEENIDTFLMPGHLGLELDRDGLLNLDTNVFGEAIAEDYLGVLAIIGADKTGGSTSDDIGFYGASSNYTTAGEYDVQVDFDGSGDVSAARIKLSTGASYRDMTISGNIATGDSTFDDDGNPVYPENSLQLTIPTTGTPSSTISATIRVKQGFTGAMEDLLDKMLKATIGSIQIDQEHVNDQIELLQDRIEDEEYRLTKRETRLVNRFARLEKMLALLQQQMGALGFGM
jgi:flagellar capping protein FliD